MEEKRFNGLVLQICIGFEIRYFGYDEIKYEYRCEIAGNWTCVCSRISGDKI
jgi:hypothetical protein